LFVVEENIQIILC